MRKGGDVNERWRMTAIAREQKCMSSAVWRISITALAIAMLAITVVVSGAQARSSRVAKTATATATTGFEVEIVTEINVVRAYHGLRPLRLSTHLEQSARGHSRQMAESGYFSHNSKDGTSYVARIRRHFAERGYRYWAVGENLLWVSPDMTARQVVYSWIASPAHRAVILSKLWRVVGVGVASSGGGFGVYPNAPVELVTADFGVRR